MDISGWGMSWYSSGNTFFLSEGAFMALQVRYWPSQWVDYRHGAEFIRPKAVPPVPQAVVE